MVKTFFEEVICPMEGLLESNALHVNEGYERPPRSASLVNYIVILLQRRCYKWIIRGEEQDENVDYESRLGGVKRERTNFVSSYDFPTPLIYSHHQ